MFWSTLIAILTISAKFATPHFLKIKVFWNESYDVKVSIYDVNKVLSLESSYIVDSAMWPKFASLVFLWEDLS